MTPEAGMSCCAGSGHPRRIYLIMPFSVVNVQIFTMKIHVIFIISYFPFISVFTIVSE